MKKRGRTLDYLEKKWKHFLITILLFAWFCARVLVPGRIERLRYPCQRSILAYFAAFPVFLTLKKFFSKKVLVIVLIAIVLVLVVNFAIVRSDPQAAVPTPNNIKSVINYLAGTMIFKPDTHEHPEPIFAKAGQEAQSPIEANRVVHIYDNDATTWTGAGSYFSDTYVDQTTINTMVERGVLELTGNSTPVAAWQTIIPDLNSPGYQDDIVAIRVNFNSAYSDCSYSGSRHVSLPQTTKAIINGLISIGIQQDNIRIFEATRPITDQFSNTVLASYSSVRMYDLYQCSGHYLTTFSNPDPSGVVVFDSGIGSQRVTDVLIESDHLITVPIWKHHTTGVSGAFKLHMGTMEGPTTDMHTNIWDPSANPLVDVYNNTHIKDKTRLIINDGIYGCKWHDASPETWSTLGNDHPESLFFSIDPVAIDSVVLDFIQAELTDSDHDHLHEAAAEGFGVHEHCPVRNTCSQINYLYFDLDAQPQNCVADLGGSCCTSGQECQGGSFTSSDDCGSLCCVGGVCQDPPECDIINAYWAT